MQDHDLGADVFTFTGDRMKISYHPQTPGPPTVGKEGGMFDYQGIEGNHTFFGQEIGLQESPLGTQLTVTLKAQDDTGGLSLTVLVPRVSGATLGKAVTFQTIAIKASSRGFVVGEGAEQAYTILPLLGVARDEIQAL